MSATDRHPETQRAIDIISCIRKSLEEYHALGVEIEFGNALHLAIEMMKTDIPANVFSETYQEHLHREYSKYVSKHK